MTTEASRRSHATAISDAAWADLLELRATRPDLVAPTLVQRQRRQPMLGPDGHLFLLAADHPARSILAIGEDTMAMANRRDLLGRLVTALAHPAVDGLVASPDIIDELALLGQLHQKVVVGSMNRGGLAESTWELDDRMTAYSPDQIVEAGLDGGKMLLRIDEDDPDSLATLVACAHATSGLASHARMAMVEPLPYTAGRLDASPDRLIRAVGVASALGHTSAYTWLKLPAIDDMATVMAATTLPALILGGAPDGDLEGALASWQRALAVPNVRGLVVGRTLLYPPDGDVAGVIEAAARIVHGGGCG